MTRLYSRENSGLLHFIFRLNCSMDSGGTRLSGLSCLTQRKMRHLLPRNLVGVKILPSPYTDNLAKILQNLVLIEGGFFLSLYFNMENLVEGIFSPEERGNPGRHCLT